MEEKREREIQLLIVIHLAVAVVVVVSALLFEDYAGVYFTIMHNQCAIRINPNTALGCRK